MSGLVLSFQSFHQHLISIVDYCFAFDSTTTSTGAGLVKDHKFRSCGTFEMKSVFVQ